MRARKRRFHRRTETKSRRIKMHDFGNYQLLAELPNEAVAKAYQAVERTTGAEVTIYHSLRLPMPPLPKGAGWAIRLRWRRIRDRVDERRRVLRETTQIGRACCRQRGEVL